MNTKEYISSGIIESYILGNATKEEAAILECVMKNNEEVRLAFDEIQKTLEDFTTLQAITPPSDLKGKIWQKLQQQNTNEITLPKNQTANSQTTKIAEKPIIDLVVKKWVAAASVLLLISLGTNFFWYQFKKQQQNQINNLNVQLTLQTNAYKQIENKWNLVSNPNMQTIVLNGVEKYPTAKAMVFWNKTTKEVYLHAVSLPQPPKGMQYQLWAIVNGKPVSAGLYAQKNDAKTVLATINNAENFAITLEKAGGANSPTLENMYVIGKV
ncbi:anti-sigma factor [Myroides sp. JBRI-B21084]|uniref:anti-sigma factor n=1 Tax=Myroides sp. JBRI-B21084 TaxID=3119977 RepID=UPI0026E45C7C|nr:anti-sigma factor [Paenimyroides cloacae]WKW45980.1 anti-sigma factor [Paenimyroides cloacae]